MTLLDSILPVARAAAARIEEIRAEPSPVDVDRKADRSPVTRADREADAILKNGLRPLVPEAAWLSEETADRSDRLQRRLVWIVDPLDGTKEFIEGIPEYAVAVALVEDGSPVLGVVVNPATGEEYYAARASSSLPIPRSSRRGAEGLALSVREGNTILASRSEIARGEFDVFGCRGRGPGVGGRGPQNPSPHTQHRGAVGGGGWDIIACGSIQLKLARVAAGVAATTFSRGPKHEWDVCAGALLVEEAGGRASALLGEPLVFNQPFPKTRGILAGAPGAYGRALAEIRKVGASDRMAEMG